MKKVLIAGNWKSNKGITEAQDWLRQFKLQTSNLKLETTRVVLFAPYTLLYALKQEIDHLHLPIELGAQDVSSYPDGAYTGAVNARQIKELADWVLVGHSERRQYFGETDEILEKKANQAKKLSLKVIYCVPDDKTAIPIGVDVVAYEPVWAIGTGKSDTPENANTAISTIKAKTQVMTVYGGSVTDQNVVSFLSQDAIDGVLPGGASLDPMKFGNLIKNAAGL